MILRLRDRDKFELQPGSTLSSERFPASKDIKRENEKIACSYIVSSKINREVL